MAMPGLPRQFMSRISERCVVSGKPKGRRPEHRCGKSAGEGKDRFCPAGRLRGRAETLPALKRRIIFAQIFQLYLTLREKGRIMNIHIPFGLQGSGPLLPGLAEGRGIFATNTNWELQSEKPARPKPTPDRAPRLFAADEFPREDGDTMKEINAYNPRFSALKRMQRSGKNAATILQDNRNLVMQLIYENGDVSRKQLADITGLQSATITIIIKELLSQGLIHESGRVDGGSGRSVQTFCLTQALYVIAIRMTAVYVKVAAYDTRGENKYVNKVFFKSDDVISECLELIIASVREIEQLLDRQRILGIGLGVEYRYRLIDDDYAVWDEKKEKYVHIGKMLHDLTRYPVFTNRAINYSTYRMNRVAGSSANLKPCHVLININIGYELESAIIIDNEIIYGKNGRCGQMKNVRVSRKNDLTYKDVLAVPAILNRVEELLPEFPGSEIASVRDLNIRDVIAGYNRHDPLCKKVFSEVCIHLGYCIAELIRWLDPDVVFVGDEVPCSDEFLMELRGSVANYSDERLAQRVCVIMKERVTQNDPALTGAADFTFQKIVGEIGLGSYDSLI